MARARNKGDETKVETGMTSADELAAIEAALNGEGDVEIMLDGDTDEVANEVDTDETSDEVDHEELARAVETDEAREGAYADATSEVEIDGEAPEAKGSKGSKGRSVAPKGPFDDMVVAMFNGQEAILDSEEGELDEAALRAMANSVSQKKVREKVLNLLDHALNGKRMSNYTEYVMALFVRSFLDGCKPVTMVDIKKTLAERGYKDGTVAAQSGQMLSLLPTLRIAKRNGSVLEPNPNSVILDLIAGSTRDEEETLEDRDDAVAEDRAAA